MNKLKMLWCLLVLAPLSLAYAQDLPEGYKIGDVVTNFSLKSTDGNYRTLDSYLTNNGVIVIFTCNHCPYSQAYEQRIIDLHQLYEPRGYPVIAINPNDPEKEPGDSYEAMVARAAEKGYMFPYLVDEAGDVALAFGARRTPHVFLLKKTEEGFKLVYVGAIDDNTEDASAAKNKYVELAIADLEAGRPVAINSTKAIGCTIKWARLGTTTAKPDEGKAGTGTKSPAPTKTKGTSSKKK